MQTMRYINLLNRITHVKTRKCFLYNNTIIFAVPSKMLSKTIGPGGKNIREIQQQLGRKVKVIKEVNDIKNASKFIEDIVDPVEFVSLEIKENEIIITAGSRNKAALLGRNKRRLIELAKIIEDNFDKELRIV